MTTYQATLIRGDGIGPEITAETIKAIEATGLSFEWEEELAGMAAVDATGTPLPDATIDSIARTGLALKGPLGPIEAPELEELQRGDGPHDHGRRAEEPHHGEDGARGA